MFGSVWGLVHLAPGETLPDLFHGDSSKDGGKFHPMGSSHCLLIRQAFHGPGGSHSNPAMFPRGCFMWAHNVCVLAEGRGYLHGSVVQ